MNSERAEVSIHEVKVCAALIAAGSTWLTNREIADKAAIPARTVRLHTLRLTKLGLLDQAELFPGHRFRWSSKADKRNGNYLRRLQEAASIFGVAL